MPFILAGSSLRVGLVAGDSLLITADIPAAVTYVIGGASLSGINKPGMDARSLYYGPVLSAAEIIIAAAASTDFEVVRGLYNQVDVGMIATLTAAEIADPSIGILADVRTTYMLNVAPYTRYRSDGTALVSLGSGGGAGATNLAYTSLSTHGVVTSDTGTDATVPLADGTNAGLMAPDQFTKLGTIETNAKDDQTAGEIRTLVGTFTTTNAGFVPATITSNTTDFLRRDGTFAAPALTGGTVIVQVGDSTVEAAATTLDFASGDFTATSTPAGEANVSLDASVARVLAPVTISASQAITAAAHGNRLLLVDTAGVVLTINNDATGGWSGDDVAYAQAIGSGTCSFAQGSGTLTTDSGASADSTTAVGKLIQAQRIGTSSWRTTSPVIVTPGGAGGNTEAYCTVGTWAAPLTSGQSGTLVTLDIEPLTVNGHMARCFIRVEAGNEASEQSTVQLLCNGVIVAQATIETNTRALGFMPNLERMSDTVIRCTTMFLNEYVGAMTQPWVDVTVSSLSAGCVLTIRHNRAALQSKTVNYRRLSAVVERP
jgi:hypothetical protein